MLLRILRRPESQVRFTLPNWWPSDPYRGQPTLAGPTVSERTALALPGVARAVSIIAGGIAVLPIRSYRGGAPLPELPPILERPNPTESRVNTLFAIVRDLLLTGNWYALPADPDPRLGYPRALVPVHPSMVGVTYEDGQAVYRVGEQTFTRGVYPGQIIHLKGHSISGHPLGIGVVDAQRDTLGHALALAEHSARFFGDGAALHTALVLPGAAPVTDEQAQLLQERFVEARRNSARPAVFHGGLDLKTYGADNQAAQLIESRELALKEVALAFNLDPYWLGVSGGDSMTYSNVSQKGIGLVKDTLRLWIEIIEDGFTEMLPNGQEARFNYDAHLEADARTRQQILAGSHWLTINEKRALEHLPPITGGDTVVMPTSMTPTPEDNVPKENADA